ncbi:hypothetical protein VTK73DRAFT_7240 [Phialemonium thermophilum]|uniref:Signal peptidase complex subunit 2 n=1 Tax=Phialemonium thermophilum TaxID=223376 RepID=A0ABR3XSZ7_9PEZI
MATSQEKITVYNLAELKNTSDDAISNYLNSLKFKQSHFLTDVRLALGYSAFAIAAACFLWDYKFGFESTKQFTAAAVALYTILNCALTLWIWKKERGIVYVGTAPSGETATIATSTYKNVPQYHISITVQPKPLSKAPQTIEITRPFAEWFDAAGHFLAPPFQTILATAIPVVGKLDPKRAATAVASTPASSPSADEHTNPYTPALLDALAAADTAESSRADTSGASSRKKNSGKRRKA